MLPSISAASFSSPNVAAASGPPLVKAARSRWRGKIGGQEQSAQAEIRTRYVRRIIAGILPERFAQDNCEQKKRAQVNRPEPQRSKAALSVIRTCVARRQLPPPSA